MAGPFAEKMYQPSSYNIQSAEDDYEQLGGALCMLEPRTFERNRIWRAIFKSTWSLVEKNWQVIYAVAELLKDKRTILDRELHTLIAAEGEHE